MAKITLEIDGNTVTVRKEGKRDLTLTEIQEALQGNRWLTDNDANLVMIVQVRADGYQGIDWSCGEEQTEWAATLYLLEDETPCPVCGAMHDNFFNQGYEAAKADAKSILAAGESLENW